MKIICKPLHTALSEEELTSKFSQYLEVEIIAALDRLNARKYFQEDSVFEFRFVDNEFLAMPLLAGLLPDKSMPDKYLYMCNTDFLHIEATDDNIYRNIWVHELVHAIDIKHLNKIHSSVVITGLKNAGRYLWHRLFNTELAAIDLKLQLSKPLIIAHLFSHLRAEAFATFCDVVFENLSNEEMTGWSSNEVMGTYLTDYISKVSDFQVENEKKFSTVGFYLIGINDRLSIYRHSKELFFNAIYFFMPSHRNSLMDLKSKLLTGYDCSIKDFEGIDILDFGKNLHLQDFIYANIQQQVALPFATNTNLTELFTDFIFSSTLSFDDDYIAKRKPLLELILHNDNSEIEFEKAILPFCVGSKDAEDVIQDFENAISNTSQETYTYNLMATCLTSFKQNQDKISLLKMRYFLSKEDLIEDNVYLLGSLDDLFVLDWGGSKQIV
jgi:hypothetical protein